MKYQIIQSDIENFRKEFESIKTTVNLNAMLNKLQEIENTLKNSSDHRKISELMKEKSSIIKKTEKFEKINELIENVEGLYELWIESGDDEALRELQSEASRLKRELKKLKIEFMLSDKYDKSNAIVEITPGAGGTESMDWASMLFRMYSRWAEEHSFEVKIIDKTPGEQAGLKSITFIIEGEYAYGYMKGENGIHRLVRISPFDANRRRHTSFAAVTVYPEIDESIKVEINPADLEIETFRASGPGGQYVNKTDSAVRIRHIPTGIIVTCQSERSQYKNKQIALKILISRLHEIERQKKEEEKKGLAEKKDISWGNQIRSYILYPYKLVKDHRTGYETALAEEVLDGQIDEFIEEYLKKLTASKIIN